MNWLIKYCFMTLWLFQACDEPAEKVIVEDNIALVSGDTTAVFYQGNTIWVPPSEICYNDTGTWSLADYNGLINGGDYKVIVLNIFASWCTPCQQEAPLMEAHYKEFKDAGLEIFSFGIDWTPLDCEAWAETFNLSYPILDDTEYAVFNQFGLSAIPYNVIIDHKMNVVYSQAGFNDELLLDIITTELDSIP